MRVREAGKVLQEVLGDLLAVVAGVVQRAELAEHALPPLAVLVAGGEEDQRVGQHDRQCLAECVRDVADRAVVLRDFGKLLRQRPPDTADDAGSRAADGTADSHFPDRFAVELLPQPAGRQLYALDRRVQSGHERRATDTELDRVQEDVGSLLEQLPEACERGGARLRECLLQQPQKHALENRLADLPESCDDKACQEGHDRIQESNERDQRDDGEGHQHDHGFFDVGGGLSDHRLQLGADLGKPLGLRDEFVVDIPQQVTGRLSVHAGVELFPGFSKLRKQLLDRGAVIAPEISEKYHSLKVGFRPAQADDH
ncbi:hypothetical protein B1H26_24165 [Amycolatopsis sp. BJA-103]|nr:hypothetical protein BKN51_20550 [Amycolatopsis sp. BJA-103]PNE16372.1 hypothetical protein B1H26_24165 [Amycolatopsis sp. BJA-103]